MKHFTDEQLVNIVTTLQVKLNAGEALSAYNQAVFETAWKELVKRGWWW